MSTRISELVETWGTNEHQGQREKGGKGSAVREGLQRTNSEPTAGLDVLAGMAHCEEEKTYLTESRWLGGRPHQSFCTAKPSIKAFLGNQAWLTSFLAAWGRVS